MNCGKESVNDCVEVFVSDRRQDFQTNTVILHLSRGNVVRAAIHGNFVTTSDESCSEMFSESLEAAIAGGNTSRSENSDAHWRIYRDNRAASS